MVLIKALRFTLAISLVFSTYGLGGGYIPCFHPVLCADPVAVPGGRKVGRKGGR